MPSTTIQKKKESHSSDYFNYFLVASLFIIPIIWLGLIAIKTLNPTLLPLNVEASDFLTLLLYLALFSLLVRPMALKIILTLAYASFFGILLYLMLPFIHATPLNLFLKIICPILKISLF